jgi:hypothetical protein
LRIACFVSVIFIIFSQALHSQKYQVWGAIRDSATHETLPGAAIYIVTQSSGTVSTDSGNYSFFTDAGYCQFKISYIGYKTGTFSIVVEGNTLFDIFLSPGAIETDEVIITAENPTQNIESAKTGFIRLSRNDLTKVPVLMGEPDLIRTLRYSPGVQNSGDGNSGFYVRGGNVDQNLILMDNAVVYNPSHVLGFFSIFNPDVINSATLIKSGVPASYGGRLSSVLNVKTLSGDFEKIHFAGTAGLIYSKATVHGPLIKNRLSYLISFRKTYVNEVIKPLAGLFNNDDSTGFLKGSTFGMYDLNIKLAGKWNNSNWLSLTYYIGKDNYRLNRDDIGYKTKIGWGNNLIALNWNALLKNSGYLVNSLSYSNYFFKYNASQFILDMDLYSSIRNLNYRIDYETSTWGLGSVHTGLEAKFYNFVPNRFMLSVNETNLNYSTYQDLYASELALFFYMERAVTDRISISAGARACNYRHLGPYDQVNRTGGGIMDTTVYKGLETIKSYAGFEPRITIRYQTSSSSSIKASYTRNYQYIHIASASSVTLPSDIWIPSTSSTPPQFGDQFTLGYYKNLFGDTYTGYSELYYKKLSNQVELLYGLGASLQDVSFENSLTKGKGYATGIEFFLEKQKGTFRGSLSYALAYTGRQFDEINNGRPFPAKYDRRHELSFTASYKQGSKWEFSAAFIYATGNAMTVPVQIYLFANNINTENSETNAFRMPPYHRLDLSVNYNLKKNSRFESDLNFSVMNVYNRANPFLIFFDIKGDILTEHSLSVTAKQIAIFPVLPSISWNFKF